MAGVAVHMMSVQDKLMAQMHQIQVQTLICSGTADKLTAVSGKIGSRTCLFGYANEKIYICIL